MKSNIYYFLLYSRMIEKRFFSKQGRCLVLFIIFFNVSGYGQRQWGNDPVRNTFFAEFASKGAFYSINYDHIFRIGEKVNYSYRIGFSIEKNSLAFPVGINFILGKQRHHGEFSLTVIPYIDKFKTFLSGDNISDKYLYVIPSAGYRFQPATGGLFLKAAIAPLILLDPPSDNFWKMDPKLFGYGSVGVGFTF